MDCAPESKFHMLDLSSSASDKTYLTHLSTTQQAPQKKQRYANSNAICGCIGGSNEE